MEIKPIIRRQLRRIREIKKMFKTGREIKLIMRRQLKRRTREIKKTLKIRRES